MAAGLIVTVVIPTLNEAGHLPHLLTTLADDGGLLAGVIVSDGGSTDATVAMATDAGARVIAGTAGRGGQLRRGVAAASGGWVWLLHGDSALPDGWAAILRDGLRREDGSRALYGRLRFASDDWQARLLETLVALRCAVFALPYGDQGLLIHTDLLAAVGGVPDLALMEDVALARSLGRRRLAPLGLTITTDASAYVRDGWFRRSAQNCARMVRSLLGAPIAGPAAQYRR